MYMDNLQIMWMKLQEIAEYIKVSRRRFEDFGTIEEYKEQDE